MASETGKFKGDECAGSWRKNNIGRLLNDAIACFENRVLDLMSRAGYSEARMAHISLTRNLDLRGTRLTELARRASMTKQSMAQLVSQLEQLYMVEKRPDPTDGRAQIIAFTPKGLEWLEAFRDAVYVAEIEMSERVGFDNFTLIKFALETYTRDCQESTPLNLSTTAGGSLASKDGLK